MAAVAVAKSAPVFKPSAMCVDFETFQLGAGNFARSYHELLYKTEDEAHEQYLKYVDFVCATFTKPVELQKDDALFIALHFIMLLLQKERGVFVDFTAPNCDEPLVDGLKDFYARSILQQPKPNKKLKQRLVVEEDEESEQEFE